MINNNFRFQLRLVKIEFEMLGEPVKSGNVRFKCLCVNYKINSKTSAFVTVFENYNFHQMYASCSRNFRNGQVKKPFNEHGKLALFKWNCGNKQTKNLIHLFLLRISHLDPSNPLYTDNAFVFATIQFKHYTCRQSA